MLGVNRRTSVVASDLPVCAAACSEEEMFGGRQLSCAEPSMAWKYGELQRRCGADRAADSRTMFPFIGDLAQQFLLVGAASSCGMRYGAAIRRTSVLHAQRRAATHFLGTNAEELQVRMLDRQIGVGQLAVSPDIPRTSSNGRWLDDSAPTVLRYCGVAFIRIRQRACVLDLFDDVSAQQATIAGFAQAQPRHDRYFSSARLMTIAMTAARCVDDVGNQTALGAAISRRNLVYRWHVPS